MKLFVAYLSYWLL